MKEKELKKHFKVYINFKEMSHSNIYNFFVELNNSYVKVLQLNIFFGLKIKIKQKKIKSLQFKKIFSFDIKKKRCEKNKRRT